MHNFSPTWPWLEPPLAFSVDMPSWAPPSSTSISFGSPSSPSLCAFSSSDASFRMSCSLQPVPAFPLVLHDIFTRWQPSQALRAVLPWFSPRRPCSSSGTSHMVSPEAWADVRTGVLFGTRFFPGDFALNFSLCLSVPCSFSLFASFFPGFPILVLLFRRAHSFPMIPRFPGSSSWLLVSAF